MQSSRGDFLSVITPLKQRLRGVHRALTFKRAWQLFRRDPATALAPDSDLLSDLVYGWGNEGWSGDPDFLKACIEQALKASDSIVECGSGLSTLLIGEVAARRGLSVRSLEHLPAWRERVTGSLLHAGIAAARVEDSPIVDYGSYHWYRVPRDLPQRIGLVICDGPPASTPGGRYGMLPLLRERLVPGSVVLLDDADRSDEQAIARRWAVSLGCTPELVGSLKRFYMFKLPVQPSPADSADAGKLCERPAPTLR
jgi:hypothetical protein